MALTKYWSVLLTLDDKAVCEALAKYYTYDKATSALRQAIRNELDRMRYLELERKKKVK